MNSLVLLYLQGQVKAGINSVVHRNRKQLQCSAKHEGAMRARADDYKQWRNFFFYALFSSQLPCSLCTETLHASRLNPSSYMLPTGLFSGRLSSFKKAKKQREMPLTILSPIPFMKCIQHVYTQMYTTYVYTRAACTQTHTQEM